MILSEVYSAYFNTVAEIIDEAINGKISEKRIMEIIDEKAFSESMLFLLPSIKNEEWLVIKKNLRTPINKTPKMPLTLLQKQWLSGLLTDPRVALFDIDKSGLDGVEPFFEYSDFVFFDQYSDGDPYASENYKDIFRTILRAINEHKMLRIYYKSRNGNNIDTAFIPRKLEYSAKDDKFRLLCNRTNNTPLYLKLANILECNMLSQVPEEIAQVQMITRSISFVLSDERNALERIMLNFSDCRKETMRLEGDNYRVILWYDANDETEILIRILSFGPVLTVTEPSRFIRLIKNRLIMQTKLTGPIVR